MRQDQLLDAMAHVDDELLESAARSMEGKKKAFPWKPLTAFAACVALVLGLVWVNYKPPIPKYENALFSAEQIAALFSSPYDASGGTKWYTTESVPYSSFLDIADVPNVQYLNVYSIKEASAQPQELERFTNSSQSALETLFEIDLPECTVEPDKYHDGYYVTSYRDDHVSLGTFHQGSYQRLWYTNADLSALEINGITTQVQMTDSDDQIMETISPIIPYLEAALGLELSQHQIHRLFSIGNIGCIEVWLYAKEEDEFLSGDYCSPEGLWLTRDVICLYFSQNEQQFGTDAAVLDILGVFSPANSVCEPYAQCKMISLKEAETLLNQGFVFGGHSCPLCMDAQEEVDFSNYDHVGLEYVFSDEAGVGVPFYTFYKHLPTSKRYDTYAKTMVPAIEVSGLEEYFESQIQYHWDPISTIAPD